MNGRAAKALRRMARTASVGRVDAYEYDPKRATGAIMHRKGTETAVLNAFKRTFRKLKRRGVEPLVPLGHRDARDDIVMVPHQ